MTFRHAPLAIGIAASGMLALAAPGQAAGFSQNVVQWSSIVHMADLKKAVAVKPRAAAKVVAAVAKVPARRPLVVSETPRAKFVAEKTAEAVPSSPPEKAAETETVAEKADVLPDNMDGRYVLLKAGEDILRVDRESGTINFCKTANGAWRCVPAPMAEDAYLQEIEDLSAEIDRLQERVDELEAAAAGSPSQTGPQAVPETSAEPQQSETEIPDQSGKDDKSDEPERQEPEQDQTSAPSDAPDKAPGSKFAAEEKELEEMLQFSESAMRRFFGLMQDLKSELEGKGDK
ncbi:hypothetical protein [Roseibium sediminis]|uniref:hypothetical protein n=1 Tax=Roseibium sediminis TaxID=1775174 RepID=UPI00123D3DEB|nr:hypothetical protein [Roseibium sediminis]